MHLLRRRPHQRLSRAVAKTLGYRLFMVVVSVVVAFVVVRNTAEALGIGLATNAVKTGTYFVHERAWDRVDWGI